MRPAYLGPAPYWWLSCPPDCEACRSGVPPLVPVVHEAREVAPPAQGD